MGYKCGLADRIGIMLGINVRRKYKIQDKIAALFSKVRNDREMDSRMRGNDRGKARMTFFILQHPKFYQKV